MADTDLPTERRSRLPSLGEMRCEFHGIPCTSSVHFEQQECTNLVQDASEPKWFTLKMQNRIEELRKANGLTLQALASAVGTSHQQIMRLERGERKLTQQWMEKIADALGVSAAELISAPGATDLSAPSKNRSRRDATSRAQIDDFVSIPRYDAALSAGPGSIVDPNAEPLGHYFFEAQWLAALTRAAGDQLAVVRVDGDSMEPALSDGDWVLIDRTQRRINRPGVYAIQVGDTAWVKRITLNLRDRLVQVISDNSVYPMQQLEEEELSIIGRVIWIVGRKI